MRGWVFGVALFALFATGCSWPKSAPLLIRADAETYVACRDLVWVENEGGTFGGALSFRVQFTGSDLMSVDVKGVKKLVLIRLRSDTPSCPH